MSFEDWLRDFCRDKDFVTTRPESHSAPVYNIRRYKAHNNDLWEVGFTYTGRVVTRHGKVQGSIVRWADWTTIHSVRMPSHTEKEEEEQSVKE